MIGVFKILQYSEMECKCVRKITEGLIRKYRTLRQHKCESPTAVLKKDAPWPEASTFLGPRFQPIEPIGKSVTAVSLDQRFENVAYWFYPQSTGQD